MQDVAVQPDYFQVWYICDGGVFFVDRGLLMGASITT
jgi:hypothetical protein